MKNIMDWFLEKVNLIEEYNIDEEHSEESNDILASRMESMSQKNEIFFKNILTYNDTKSVIDHYKLGAMCIIQLSPDENQDARGMLNYICGGIYALDGKIIKLGVNVFIALHGEDELV